eukprot:ANDGO_05074.mRNA.1 hypothetical protein
MGDSNALHARITATLRSIDAKIVQASESSQQLLVSVRQFHAETRAIATGLQSWVQFLEAFSDSQKRSSGGSTAVSEPSSSSSLTNAEHCNSGRIRLKEDAVDSSALSTPRLGSPPRTAPLKRSFHDISGSTDSTPRMPSPPRTTPLFKNRIYQSSNPQTPVAILDLSDDSSAVHSTPRMNSPPRTTRKMHQRGSYMPSSSVAGAVLAAANLSFSSDTSSTGSTPRMASPPKTTSILDQLGGRTKQADHSSAALTTAVGGLMGPPTAAMAAEHSFVSESGGEIFHTPNSGRGRSFAEASIIPSSVIAISALKPSRRSLGAESVASYGGLMARFDELLDNDRSYGLTEGDNSQYQYMDRSFGVARDPNEEDGQHEEVRPMQREEEDKHHREGEPQQSEQLQQPEQPKQQRQQHLHPAESEESHGLDTSKFPKAFQTGTNFQQLVEVYSIFFVNPDPNVSSSQNTVVAFTMEQLTTLTEIKQDRIKLMLDLLVSRKYLKPMYVQGQYFWRRTTPEEQGVF